MTAQRTLQLATTPPCPLGTPRETAAILGAFNVHPSDTEGAKEAATLVALADGLAESPCVKCQGCKAVAALQAQYATLQ